MDIGFFLLLILTMIPSLKEPQSHLPMGGVTGVQEAEVGHPANLPLREAARFSDMELFSEAMDQYLKARSTLENHPNDSLLIRVYTGIAWVQLSSQQFEQARNHLREALNLASGVSDSAGLALAYGYLGICSEKEGDYLKALDYQKTSLELYTRLADAAGIARIEENLGSIFEDLGQYDLSFEHFSKAYDYWRQFEAPATANVLNNLGDIRRKQGRFQEAITFTRKALELAGRLQDKHQLESAHKDLSKVYAATDEYRLAYDHLSQAESLGSELMEAHNTNQLNTLQTLYDTERKEAEIELLRQQNKVSTANQRVMAVSGGAMASVLLVIILVSARKRRSHQKLQHLRQQALAAELRRKEMEEESLQQEIKLKSAALTRYSLNLSQKNKILGDLSRSLDRMASRQHMDVSAKMKALVQEIDYTLSKDQEWDDFMHIFDEVHPDFMKKLNERANESLSSTELRLAMLLRMNLSSKEIASILRVTPDSVRVARYRLRKKLPIDSKMELVTFMVEL